MLFPRVPDPPRREGQCPSDIEILLRDYSRAREEARAEIARARDRLRERTEQEKRRLQQQALSQAVKVSKALCLNPIHKNQELFAVLKSFYNFFPSFTYVGWSAVSHTR